MIIICALATVLSQVPTVTIAEGVHLPMVVLGTGSGQKGDVAKATEIWLTIDSQQGIDTAYDYQDETEIAQGIAAAKVERASFFLETKIPCGTAASAQSNFATNLAQLGVAYVDLTLIHTQCEGGKGSLKETWEVLEAMVASGKTKSIGVSHLDANDLTALLSYAKIVPAVNQCELSVEYHDEATIAYCAAHGITYQSYSPLCGGANGSSCNRHGGHSVLTIKEVIAIAAAHNVSAAQIGLKWIVQRGLPLATAVWRADYAEEDIDLWSWGNLTEAEMKTLSTLPGRRL
jgi:diketogulonate reductase-like aldo/keto reductase